MSEAPAIYRVMSAVQADLASHGIAKANTNTYDRYQFRGIDDVYNTLSPIMAKHGLVARPSMINRECTQVSTSKGGTQNHVLVTVEVKFIAAEDGSSESAVFFGEAMDRGDKATPKALTAAYKYGMFTTFCIPTEGAPDADSESPEIARGLTNAQCIELDKLIQQCSQGTLPRFLAAFKADSLANIHPGNFDKAKSALKKKIAASAEERAQGEQVVPT